VILELHDIWRRLPSCSIDLYRQGVARTGEGVPQASTNLANCVTISKVADFMSLNALPWTGCEGVVLPSCCEHDSLLLTTMVAFRLGGNDNVKKKMDSGLVRLSKHTCACRLLVFPQHNSRIYIRLLNTTAAQPLPTLPALNLDLLSVDVSFLHWRTTLPYALQIPVRFNQLLASRHARCRELSHLCLSCRRL
jgi:hypothetical protein